MIKLPITFRGQLMAMFSLLLTCVMTISTFLVFGEMKNMVISKHIEIAKKEVRIGTIPLLDGMLLKEIGKPLPQDYFDRTLKNLRSDPSLKTLYAYFLDPVESTVLAFNAEPDWTNPPLPGNRIFYHGNEWALQVMDDVSISTKSWGKLVLGFDATPILREVRQALILVLSVGLIVISVTLIAINGIAKRLTSRLNVISKAVDNFDLDSKPDTLLEGQDEIGRLAAHINDLRERLLRSKSELRRSERHVSQAEKLAAIGRLAAGVAHEINNPLTGIRHAIANILSDPENAEDRDEYLNLIDEALKKIELVIRKLLGFSRKKGDDLSQISINDAIQTTLQLLDYSIKSKNVHVHLELGKNLPNIVCGPHLLDEITMNLIINAVDAVGKNGHVTCSTGLVGEDIILEIKDDGHGISSRDEPFIFEPFFTTKSVGEGTGLGLYVTREIVQGLGGKIDMSTEKEKGTKFTISLPGINP